MLSREETKTMELHIDNCPDFQTFEPSVVVSGKSMGEKPKRQWNPLRRWIFVGFAISIVLFLTINLLTITVRPTIVNALSGEKIEAINNIIEIQFSKPMNKSSVEAALKISPKTLYLTEIKDRTKLIITFPKGLLLNKSYELSISEDATDVYGFSLKQSIVLYFDSPSDNNQTYLKDRPATVVREMNISWTWQEIMSINEQVSKGSKVSRLVVDQAAMDDLYSTHKLSPTEYQFPVVEKTDGINAVVRFDKKDNSGYARATLEKLGRKDKHGAWFTTKLEIFEYK
jgi:hypothetical protein